MKMMACRLLMFVFSLAQGNQAGQPFIVTQSPDVEVAFGSSARLQCNIAELFSSCSHVDWLKLDPRKPMVLHVTDRVKMVNPNDINNIVFNSVCWATIPEVTVQDSGMYYCVLSHGQFAYVGNGTRLTVTEPNSVPPAPSIEIIPPMAYASTVPLLCLVSGVIPSQARVSWLINGTVENGWTESALEEDDDPLKRLTQNQILVPAEEWEKGIPCFCVVEFAGKSFSKTLQHDDQCFAVFCIYTVAWVTSSIILLLLVGTTAVCLCKNPPLFV